MSRSETPAVREWLGQEELGGRTLQVAGREGYPEWLRVSPAERLLADQATLEPGERVLVCPGGPAALGAWAGLQVGAPAVTVLNSHAVALDLARKTLRANGLPPERAQAGVPGRGGEMYDIVLFRLPKGRDLARLLVLACYGVLHPGGRLYMAGANREGIKSAIDDVGLLFGPGELLRYRAGNRAIVFTRPAKGPEPLPEIYRHPGIAEGTWHTFEVPSGGTSYTIRSRPGVFSWRTLDAGTALLLEVLAVRPDDQVLDLGCGYGIIGLHAATQAPQGHATLVDAELLACESARETLRANDADNAEVLFGDGASVADGAGPYSLVVSNPPFHAGQATTLSLTEGFIRAAHRALSPRGRLVLVANRFLPYQRVVQDVFGDVSILAETGQFTVLSATRNRRG